MSIAVAVFAVACGRSEEAQEADRVLHAIDVLREAPTDALGERRKLLDALGADPAHGKLARDARDACVRAYAALLDGLDKKERVRARLDASVDLEMLADLAEAEKNIKVAQEAMPGCDTAVSLLRRANR